ncbi:peptide deformylase [unidentified bacterial endosymbiont]|uniref:peptide deformylase n=1 Tax=unidentified bacterial endosymbiont TaxID=2355 RepID=UPI00209CB350|nr:peptide deformylase [unidentified bacterial endosymbiont]
MAVLPLLRFPDKRLRIKAAAVAEINHATRTIVQDLLDTMYAESGIGLAATQVNLHQQIVVIDLSDSQEQPQVFINPRLITQSGSTSIREGCLSVPDVRALVPRASQITVRAFNAQGCPFELQAEGLLAICLQHEIDHLNGTLFIDYLSSLKRQRLHQRFTKMAKQQAALVTQER